MYLEWTVEIRVLWLTRHLSPHSDLYATVQLWADSKPLTTPVQTAYKSFKNERRYDGMEDAQYPANTR
jgi:hypothetical protein